MSCANGGIASLVQSPRRVAAVAEFGSLRVIRASTMNPPVDPQRRYAGKPLLKLLDSYVLWVIGALPKEQESLLQQMTPQLRQTWNRSEEHWNEVLASQMQFPATMPSAIRDIWQKNQAIAASSRATLTPLDFAYMFVDQNFNP